MSLTELAVYLAILWSALYYLRWRRQRQQQSGILPGINDTNRKHDILDIRTRSGGTLSITLRNFHLKAQTNATDTWYETISRNFIKTGVGRCMKMLYTVGIITSLLGMVLGSALLVLNASAVVGRMMLSVPIDTAMSSMDQFSKRALKETTSYTVPSTEIYAIIPGVTVPWSHFPLIMIALFVAQIIHEAGHFIAAALESIAVDSVGVALTVCLPSAFVALSPMADEISHVSRMRVIAAGAWHNLLTWALLFGLSIVGSKSLWSIIGYDDVSNRGLAVIGVENDSPFTHHLTPGSSVITALDDLSLARTDSFAEDEWSRYLLTPMSEQTPLEQGWCVEAKWFNEHSSNCCQTNHTTAPPAAPVSCFVPSKPIPSFSDSWIYGKCIDPVPILINVDSNTSKRCQETADCTKGSPEEDMECIRPDVGAQLLRIRVETPEKDAYLSTNAVKIVVWGGPRREVWEQVSIGSRLPRWRLLPTWLPTLISLFFSYFSTLSLSLFFFNLLVLPALDGSEFLTTLLLYFSKYSGDAYMLNDVDMEARGTTDRLSHVQNSQTSVSALRQWCRRRRGLIERTLRYITIATCFVSVVGILLPT